MDETWIGWVVFAKVILGKITFVLFGKDLEINGF